MGKKHSPAAVPGESQVAQGVTFRRVLVLHEFQIGLVLVAYDLAAGETPNGNDHLPTAPRVVERFSSVWQPELLPQKELFLILIHCTPDTVWSISVITRINRLSPFRILFEGGCTEQRFFCRLESLFIRRKGESNGGWRHGRKDQNRYPRCGVLQGRSC